MYDGREKMFEVKVISSFCAAHYLDNYKGKCELMHGHNWKVEVIIRSKRLDSRGMVIDFKDLKKFLNDILSRLDHKLLNELPFFRKKNTTSEQIAQYIFTELNKRIKKMKNASLKEVVVWEQENSCAVYRETPER